MAEDMPPPLPQFGVTEAPKRIRAEKEAPQLPNFGAPPTEYEKDWGAASAGEVAKGFAKEFLPSVGRGIAAIPEMILNPSQTGAAFKQAGTGIASKVRGAFGEEQEPEKKAQDEAVLNAIIEPWSSWAGFKKALATDPYSVLSVLAIPVSGGAAAAGAGAKALGAASLAGKALRGAEVAGKGAAMAMDPLYGGLKLAGVAYEKAAKPAAQAAISDVSGISKPALETAYEAGKTSKPALKDAFNTFAKGEGDALDFSRTVDKASKAMRDAEMAKWIADKDNVLSLKAPVSSQPILDAIQKARDYIGPRQTATDSALVAHRLLDRKEAELLNRLRKSPNSIERSAIAMDQYKKSLWELADNHPSKTAGDALKIVFNGVRQSIEDTTGNYLSLMEKHQRMTDKLTSIKKSLGAGNNADAVREISMFIRGMDDVEKGRFIAELAKYDPRIPYMVAGATINQAAGNPSTWARALSYGQMANIGWGIQRGDPIHMVGAAGALGAQKVFGSPTTVGKMTYGLGTAARGLENVAEAMPPGTGEVLGTTARILPGQLSRTQNEELMESIREPRKSGGRVISADHLVAEVDRAKKRINSETESLLNTPDNHVAHALEVANRHLEG